MSESTYEVSAQRQQLEATEQSITKINELHADCCNMDRDVKAVVLKKINSARECGRELANISKIRGFKKMFKAKGVTGYTFPFSYETASLYMRLGRKCPDPILVLEDGITCLKDALYATEALKRPKGHGSQALHKSDFFAAIGKRLFDFRAFWGNQTGKKPVNTWDIHQVEQALTELDKLDEPRKELEQRKAELTRSIAI